MIGKIEANNVNFWYGDFHALKGISMSIEERSVVAFYRTFGMWQIHFPPVVQSHERSYPEYPPDR